MAITVEEQYQANVVRITGKFLGSVHGQEFKAALEELKKTGHPNVVVDLGETEAMDSSGIGALIEGLTTMRKAGGEIRLANLEQQIRPLFLMTNLLGPVFKHYPSVDEAVDSFIKDPPAVTDDVEK